MGASSSIVITGAAGLIGSNVVAALNDRGIDQLVLVDHLNHPAKQQNLDRLRYTSYFDKTDFRQRIRSGLQQAPRAVFHLGACSSTTEMNEAYLEDNNVAYTRELCEWTLQHHARFVYASSAATYGDGALGYSDNEKQVPTLKPLNPYGRSKQKFDQLALDSGWLERIVGIKYFNVYGPGEDHKGDMRSVVNKAFHQIAGTGRLQLFKSHRDDYGDGQQERDFVYVKDAVAVTLFFLDHPEVAGLFNCGTGRTHTWLELANAVFKAMGKNPNIEFIPMPEAIRDKYQYFTLADISKLRAAGFQETFTELEDAVRDYANQCPV